MSVHTDGGGYFSGDVTFAADINVHGNITNSNGALKLATVTLTNTQIRALPTTGIEIIPAPGAGKYIAVLGCWLRLDNLAGAYLADTNASVMLMNGTTFETQMGLIAWNGQLTNPDVYIWQLPLSGVPGTGDFAGLLIESGNDLENQSVTIKDDWDGVADYTGGHASNTLKVFVYYDTLNFN